MKPAIAVMSCAIVLAGAVRAQAAPTITALSDRQGLNVGQALLLQVEATGTTPLSYAWQKDGVAIPGATASSYAVAAASASDQGIYRVAVKDGAGTTLSPTVPVAVSPAVPPYAGFVTTGSVATYNVGDNVSITPYISGSPPFTIVWRKNGQAIVGATSAVLNLSNVQKSDTGDYSITVTNPAGTATAETQSVYVVATGDLPLFESTPADTTVTAGQTLELTAEVGSASNLTYQWYKDGTAIDYAISPYYSVSSVAPSDAGVYTLAATNVNGTTTSNPVTISVTPATPPAGVTIEGAPNVYFTYPGSSQNGITYSAEVADGSPPFQYRWRRNGVDMPYHTSSQLSLAEITTLTAGVYSVVVSNAAGTATSPPLVVSMDDPQIPLITFDPVSQATYGGNSAYLKIGYRTSVTPTKVQWSKNGVAVPGATSDDLLAVAPNWPDSDTYTATVSNAYGSVTSRPATISTLPPVAPSLSNLTQDIDAIEGEYWFLDSHCDGIPTPTLQWFKDGVPIAGANSISFFPPNRSLAAAGVYTLKATNVAGSATSREIHVTISPATLPVFILQPAGGSVLAQSGFSFYTAVEKQQGDTYQWFFNGQPIAGQTGSSFSVSSAQATDAGTYRVEVTNAAGTTASDDAVITVDSAASRPVIVGASASQLVVGGTYAAVSVNLAPNIDTYTVVWKKDGAAIPGATATLLSFRNFDSSMTGTYTAEITVGGSTYVGPPITLDLVDRDTLPSVRIDPGSTTVPHDGTILLIAEVGGELPSTYQWQRDGVDLIGQTNRVYAVSPGAVGQEDIYTLKMTNRNGSTISQPVTITTVPDRRQVSVPSIAAQPQSQAVINNLGAGVELYPHLTETSFPILSFQWYKDGVAIPGETYLILYTTSSGVYKFTVSNSAGTTTSDPAVVTFISPPVGPKLTVAPVSQSGFTGDTVTFSVTASGAGPIAYQWLKDGVAIAGATGANLVLNGIAEKDLGNYSVIVFDANNLTLSGDAPLTIRPPASPVITAQPGAQFTGVGGSATFSVTATGGLPATYQWRKDGVAIAGATSSTLTLGELAKSDAGTYTVVVTNSLGSTTSTGGVLKVYDQTPAAPAFSVQPASQTFSAGEEAKLTVEASGYPAPALQWYKNGAALAGATDATLAIGPMTAAKAGSYYVVATNDLGMTQSSTATIKLPPSPYASTYFGTESPGTGHWALVVNTDGTGTLLAYLSGRSTAVKVDLVVNPDGSFSVTGTEIVPASVGGGRVTLALGAQGAAGAASVAGMFTLAGQIGGNGSVSAQFTEFGIDLTGTADTANGTTASYTATALGTVSGTTYAVMAPDGQAVVVVVTPSGIDGAAGTVDGSGQFTATTAGGGQLTLALSGDRQSVSATLTPAGSSNSVSFGGLSGAVQPRKRLANISARAMGGTGNNVAIGGFVIGGTGTKRMLIRAVGPTLTTQGIPSAEAMVDPTIELHDALHQNAVIASIDNWGDYPAPGDITTLASQLGAAALSGSDVKSAATILDLPAGVYSFIAEGKNQTSGVVLVEVYDADASDSPAKLVNISARANCGTGDNVTIGGFVVDGNAPKTVLLRAVGPTLTTQGIGVQEVLQDPTIEVHDALHGNAIIAINDNWGDNANSANIVSTGARLGATPLAASDTTSSALLLTLPHGVYSFVVQGKNNASGIVLVEVYDAD